MVERVEDMQLPNAVVQRIIKEALPDGINVAKDARSEISKAASIFVLYLTSTARHQLHLRKQKTLGPADVLHALEVMEMENFVEPLKRALEQHKRQQKNKKDKKQQDAPRVSSTEANNADTILEEVVGAEEDFLETDDFNSGTATEDPNAAETEDIDTAETEPFVTDSLDPVDSPMD